MLRRISFLIAIAIVSAGATAPTPKVQDLVIAFDRLTVRTVTLSGPARAATFRAEIGSRLPGVYPRKTTSSDVRIAAAISAWPQQRAMVLAARDRVVRAYAQGTARFARAFPGYRPVMPTYVIHSLGQMDGGTREVAGKTVLVFGADMIAKLHAKESIDPFVDHELFHTYHARFFPSDCEAVWCQLWIEGLATYISARMNPQATDSELLLTYPQSIRAATDARMTEALCDARANLASTDETVTGRFFNGNDRAGPFPARFGYYLGLRIAEWIGKTATLDQMARMPAGEVRRRMDEAFAAMANCPA